MDIVERLRKHALPDPHDEREVLHAPLLREAAEEIERLRAALKKANAQTERFEREWYLRGDALEEITNGVYAAPERLREIAALALKVLNVLDEPRPTNNK